MDFIISLSKFPSQEIGNLGALLSGIGTWAIFIYGSFQWKHWNREKRAEKLSSIAEESLNHLEAFIAKVNTWISEASCCMFVYSKHSEENFSQFQKASKEEKEILHKMYQDDPYEVNNFCRKLNAITDEFIIAKNRSVRLNRSDVNTQFEKLESIIKKLAPRLARIHRKGLPIKEEESLKTFINDEAPQEIEKLFLSIREILHKILTFEIKQLHDS